MDFKRGDLENLILNAVWYMEENGKDVVSVSDVQNRINEIEQKNWAYTTVKTVMDRLAKKTLVSRLKQGKKYFYKSSFSRMDLGILSIKKIIRQFYNDDSKDFMKAAEAVCQDVFVAVE